MQELPSISDSELLANMPALVKRERVAMVEVIEHLVEIDRRRLYLEQACSSLYSFCIERLGYSEDGAMKRVRVARLAGRLPAVLEELRTGSAALDGPVSAVGASDRGERDRAPRRNGAATHGARSRS